MTKTREQIREERLRLKAEYSNLYNAVAALLFRWDPMGISSLDNSDEYGPETGTIVPRLRGCKSADDVRVVVHEEFVRWFGSDIAGLREQYSQISADIWQIWQGYELNARR